MQDPGSHCKLDAEFPGLLLEEETPVPFTAVQTEKIDSHTTATAATAKNCTIHTPVVCYYSNASTHILVTTNPSPETNINEESDDEN